MVPLEECAQRGDLAAVGDLSLLAPQELPEQPVSLLDRVDQLLADSQLLAFSALLRKLDEVRHGR
jgi:hypothetical protein